MPFCSGRRAAASMRSASAYEQAIGPQLSAHNPLQTTVGNDAYIDSRVLATDLISSRLPAP